MSLDLHPGHDGAALRSIPAPTALAVAPVVTPALPEQVGSPWIALGVMASIGAGVYAGTLLVAVGLIVVVLTLASFRAGRRAMRRGLTAHVARKRRAERRRARERKLDDAGVARDGLAELVVLGDEIERRDPALFSRHEIEDLLDRHVELTLVHERCLRAMRMADRDQLVRARCEHRNRPGGSARRADMFDRRIRYWDQCKLQADKCDEELAVLADLIRLLAQKAICPTTFTADDLIDRRLGELDDEETALHQLSLLDAG